MQEVEAWTQKQFSLCHVKQNKQIVFSQHQVYCIYSTVEFTEPFSSGF